MSQEGTLGIFDTYLNQGNPLVILKGNEWVELTLTDLIKEIDKVTQQNSFKGGL